MAVGCFVFCRNWCIVRFLHGLDYGLSFIIFLSWGLRALLDGNWVFGFWILGENCGKHWIMHGLIFGTIVIFGDGIMVL